MSKQTQTQNQQAEPAQAKTAKQEIQGLETAVAPAPILQRVFVDPRTTTPADVKTLQRTVGNRALGRLLIQRKMTLGPVGDKYEQEADAVAQQVVTTLSTQRQEDEEELQTKPISNPQSPISTLQRQEEEEELQTKPISNLQSPISALQRQEEEEELQAKGDPMLAGGELSGDVETAVHSAKSGGRPLDDQTRQPMEQAFNADFSGVKIHTGGEADGLNRAMSARAFTSGQDVFFRSGEYNPGSSAGQELLAHELTHTIQQGGAPLKRQPSPFLLGGLGAVAPNLIQRARALAKTNQPTYRPDPQDGDKVYNTSVRGTRRTGHTLDHYQNFETADNPATNKANYYKITSPKYQGEFVYRPNYLQINDHNETRIVKSATHIKEGKSGGDWEAAQPGDVLDVTGQTEDNSYFFVRNKRTQNGKRGTVAQEKTAVRDAELAAAGNQLDDAATTAADLPFYRPLSDDRTESVGINGELGGFNRIGATLRVDFTAAGVDSSGEKKLVVAESVRRQGAKGYVEKEKVRKIADTTAALQTEYQTAQNDQQAQLEQITTDFVVTGQTIFRQPQTDSNGNITFKDNFHLQPGEILTRTPESRAVFKQDKMWATEMKFRGIHLGMVNMEKAQALLDDQKLALKLNSVIDTHKPRTSLQKVLVTEKTTLRAIEDRREHTFAVGPKTLPLQKDTAVYVDFSIKGVDENFNYDWIFAQTEGGSFGYIREEKVTNPHTEGNVKEITWNGVRIEGNEIPAGNQYIYKDDGRVGKRGDRFVPVPNRAVATHDVYYGLRNRRTGYVCRIMRKNVVLASSPLIAANAPDKTALVLEKTHLRQPVEDRIRNSGVSDTQIGDPLQPGDKALVSFQTAGMFAKGDTEWYYARKGNNLGYIRGSKIRESGAEQLQEVTQRAYAPNKFIPAYVSGKTHLRDDKKRKQEAKKAGDQIMVNYGRHPSRFIKPKNSDDYVVNPHFPANELDRWLLVQSDDDAPRYIREHKVTVQFLQPDYKPPSAGSSSSATYQAFQIISGAVKDVNFELAGGWGVGTTGDIYEGIKGVKGMEEGQEINSGFFSNPSDGPTHGGEYHNLAIAGVTGGLLGLIGTVEGIVEVFGPGRNWKERLLGMLKITQSGLAGVAASARAAENIYAIKDSRLQSSDTASSSEHFEAFEMAGKVAGWAAGIANAIGAVKGLFLSIHSFITSHKKAPERGISLIKGLLEAGQAGIKAARFLTKTFDATGTSNALAVSVPFIGLAVDMADIVLGAFKTYRGLSSETDAETLLQQDDLKQKVVNAFTQTPIDTTDPHKGEKNKLFWKEFRGVRSVNTLMTKTTYLRLNPKILFAINNKAELDKRDAVGSNQVVERSLRYINSDYYQVVDNQQQPTGSVVVIIDGDHIEVTPAAQKAIREYELVSKVQEVSKKKRIYGIEEIEKGVLNLVGDVLGMGGPTAMAGAIIKGVTAAADAGFNLARFINKQMDNRQGKVYASHLKYQGKVEGTDKSQAKKTREYYDHAIFILQEISDLAGPAQIIAAAQNAGTLDTYRQQYTRVQKHVEITGVNTTLFYEAAGKPVEQVGLLAEALGER